MPDGGRPLRDEVLVRFPFLASAVAAGASRLKPGSALRRRLVDTIMRVAWAGINRGDFEPALLAYERDVDVQVFGPPGVGLAENYSGDRGWIRLFDDMFESFGETRFRVLRVLDGGDRLVVEVGLTASGKLSGAPVEAATSNVYYLSSRGKVARQELYWVENSWEAALDAAGLR